jgi:hypothetical protein
VNPDEKRHGDNTEASSLSFCFPATGIFFIFIYKCQHSRVLKKYHIIVPKQYINKIESPEGKQVKIIMTDEL